MNVFFYAAAGFECTDRCDYRTCSRKCISLLVNLSFFANMRVLPGGSGLTTPLSMDLRCGDIIILYAANRQDIGRLLAIRTFLDAFRILLIVGDERLVHDGEHFNLNPRYTIVLGRNMQELGAVVDHMTTGGQRQRVHDHA